jgi:CRISPR-associated protein Cmr2
VIWNRKIQAFLHDPPDKALSISGHESRRDLLLQTLNLKFDIPSEFDRIASSMERIVPKTDIWIDFSRTDKSLHPILRHPITGSIKEYETLSQAVLGIRKLKTRVVLGNILNYEIEALKSLKADDSKVTYFRIWRFFKDLIAKLGDEFAHLPADTRCPDHTIWDHLNASSAIYSAISKDKPALLMFKLSPVQDFIKNARKERDLWAGSHLLSF